MPANTPRPLQSGGLLQGGIPREPSAPPTAHDGLVRGVVIATYVSDDPGHPLLPYQASPSSVYCDVLCYGTLSGGSRYFLLPGVAVSQPLGGLHHGVVYRPKATTRMLDGTALSDSTPLDVSQMDGDHVLVMFIEGKRNQPVIIGALLHPRSDVGNDPNLPVGQRQRLRLVDGDPLFVKHHGTAFGVNNAGDFCVDTTLASDGTLSPSGGEVKTGGGDVKLNIGAQNSRVTQLQTATSPASPAVILREVLSAQGLSLDAMELPLRVQAKASAGVGLDLKGAGEDATLQIGDGAYHVALAEALKDWWTQSVVPYLANHVHLTGVGPTSPPTLAPPAYDSAITSAAVSVPNKGGA